MITRYDPSRIAIAIPARMESKRLTGKPLMEVGGKPLLRWAWEAASTCKEAGSKFVVTDSRKIEEYCWNRCIPCYRSEREHPTGTDRIAEVIAKWRGNKLTHVINLQCDEPDVTGEDLDWMARGLQINDGVFSDVQTLSAPLGPSDLGDRNATKVVSNFFRQAMYFSRNPLPLAELHVGVYGMSINMLEYFHHAERPSAEISEQLEQLRFLFNKKTIGVFRLDRSIRSINTPEDVEQWCSVAS